MGRAALGSFMLLLGTVAWLPSPAGANNTARATPTAAPLAVTVEPWKGADLPGAAGGEGVSPTIRYRLSVVAKAGSTVTLEAVGAPPEWVAAFCDGRLCSPKRTTMTIPTSGARVLEFSLVPPQAAAPGLAPRVRIVAREGSATATVATGDSSREAPRKTP